MQYNVAETRDKNLLALHSTLSTVFRQARLLISCSTSFVWNELLLSIRSHHDLFRLRLKPTCLLFINVATSDYLYIRFRLLCLTFMFIINVCMYPETFISMGLGPLQFSHWIHCICSTISTNCSIAHNKYNMLWVNE